jgi:hypothetical protein
MTTVADIKKKIRYLTQSLSTTQISEATLLEYINTFYLYDFSQIIQVSDLRKNVSFTTTPYVDSYSTTSGNYIYNLKDFKDAVIVTDAPVYLSGNKISLYQDPTTFYLNYNKTKTLGSIGTGDGATTNFTYTLPTKVLHNSLIVGSLNVAGEGIMAHDVPNTDTFGRESNNGTMHDNADTNIGTINYLTGELDVTFATAPADGEDVTYELYQFQASVPSGILFFDNTFTLRPVPDKVYEVKLQARVQPTELTLDTDSPLIKEWCQFIAYGAAKKILEDRSDIESVNRISPEFERQKILVMRKTSLNKSKDSTGTIFSGSSNLASPGGSPFYGPYFNGF